MSWASSAEPRARITKVSFINGCGYRRGKDGGQGGEAPVGPLIVVGAAIALGVLGYLYGYLRAGIAIAMFLVLVVGGIRFVRQMVETPAEPEIEDVSGYGLKYVCENCGLELRVERASKERPPTHCTEPMTLVREGGRPPLRPL